MTTHSDENRTYRSSDGDQIRNPLLENRYNLTSSANCLVEGETGRIVAADPQIAGWLGVGSDYAGELSIAHFVPLLSKLPLAPLGDNTATRIVCSDGSEFEAMVNISPLVGQKDPHLLVSIRPLGNQADEILHRDALTGLPDRRELANQRTRWQRHTPDVPIPHAVLFVDLDGFKLINDQHGHALGDRVLVELAARWQRCIRDGDLLARYGGDEFVVLLAGIRNKKELEPIIARLAAATAEPIQLDELELSITATIGVALAADTSVDLDQLLAEADRDMYGLKGEE